MDLTGEMQWIGTYWETIYRNKTEKQYIHLQF